MDFERLPDTAWKKLTAYLDLRSRIRFERVSKLFFIKFSQSWDEVNSINFQFPVDAPDPQPDHLNFAIAQSLQNQSDAAIKRCLPDKVKNVLL